jgi:hypothetical protein
VCCELGSSSLHGGAEWRVVRRACRIVDDQRARYFVNFSLIPLRNGGVQLHLLVCALEQVVEVLEGDAGGAAVARGHIREHAAHDPAQLLLAARTVRETQ